ncbi:hypothetical protein GCM10010082_18920 [Kushneria pakistanensis]|uniref:DUF2782 domain-containing protein n=1 Tax=Kushneria pakistanensis TaxID=1508770 RepID=A0ABQ3FJ28_9GAMM|nr:DUF2782 domain-containing protein [Kushneria pakistanensis]GHC26067.1 hypothetical protein GCM10010082_18920 [Kushneria pakistanensis]
MTIGRMLPALVLSALLMPGLISSTALAESQGEVTTREDGERIVREYRLEGQLYAIEVIDKGQRTVLLDTDGKGNFRRQPADTEIKAPSWTGKSAQ